MNPARALILVIATAASPAMATGTGGATANPAGGDGSSRGASPKGFDVSGSHPLPNGNEQEPPGRGACGCRITDAGTVLNDAEHGACIAVLALALAALRRRTVA
jgi:hypothetical protein